MVQAVTVARVKEAFEGLASSDYASWMRRIEKLNRLLRAPAFDDVVKELEPYADLEAWLARVHASMGGMVGSGKMNWPQDPRESAALAIKLVSYLAEEEQRVIEISQVLFANDRFDDDIRDTVFNILIPSYDDLAEFLADSELLEEPVASRVDVPRTKNIFLVHGHDGQSKSEVARFLERLGLNAIILHERPNKGRTLIAKFQEEASEISFAVVLITADDVGGKGDGALNPRARQNVVFELGYFIGRLGHERVCALVTDGVEKPSDYDGVAYVPLDKGGAWKGDLARELAAARIPVDLAKAFGVGS